MKTLSIAASVFYHLRQATRYEALSAGDKKHRDSFCVFRVRRMLKAKKLIRLILGRERKARYLGNKTRVLPVGHSTYQTVAHSAHAARGNGSKDKNEDAQTERKPAAPLSTLFIALKADNVEKSAAKQPASEYRSVSNTHAKGIVEEIGH